jgi:hypothetical protein
MESDLRPIVRHVFDICSDRINERLTPGGKAEISGEKIEFDPVDPQQGIFLKNLINMEEIRLSQVFNRRRGTRVSVIVPKSICAGTYDLIVRNVFYNIESKVEGKLRRRLEVI